MITIRVPVAICLSIDMETTHNRPDIGRFKTGINSLISCVAKYLDITELYQLRKTKSIFDLLCLLI